MKDPAEIFCRVFFIFIWLNKRNRLYKVDYLQGHRFPAGYAVDLAGDITTFVRGKQDIKGSQLSTG